MPKNKDLKRLVRKRMQKTGESYTTARSQLLRKKAPPAREFAEIAGMSDRAVEAKTGLTWEGWVRALDRARAHELSHKDIARHVLENHDVSFWWAQSVTVGYERIRGLRDVGQRRGGGYDANKSKTLPVPLARLYRAFSDKRTRLRWLPEEGLKIRSSTKERSMRIAWDDGTAVDVHFTEKGPEKSQVAIQHRELPSAAARERMKEYWGERLSELSNTLKKR